MNATRPATHPSRPTPVRGAALRRLSLVAAVVGASVMLSACAGRGGNDEAKTSSDKTARAAAVSLQQAMDASARGIDGVRGTKSSLKRLESSLQSSIDQTNDVIALLTPRVAESPAEAKLLQAARDQRTFLQLAKEAAEGGTRGAALSAVARARDTGRRTSTSYSSAATESSALAGLLPASTTFNTGRLRDAVSTAYKKKSSTSTTTKNASTGGSGGGGAAPAAPAPSSCGSGVSANGNTSCPFARSVAEAAGGSGGTVDVYSSTTGTTYEMNCSGGYPNVCRGGNNAVVTIR